jgi:hypothetical protein
MQPFTHVVRYTVPAMATNHAVTIARANYCGTEGDLTYVGGSLIAGPHGEMFAQAGETPALLITEIPPRDPARLSPSPPTCRPFQVPHYNGGGYRDPSAIVEMRRTKAEGDWGVIFTEQTKIHPTSEITPFIEQHLREDKDIPALARMAEAMKFHGALAGIQLAYSASTARTCIAAKSRAPSPAARS